MIIRSCAKALPPTVEIRYDKRQFRLRVRDDGTGIDEDTMQRQPSGHFGLPGMRERAEIVGGHLEGLDQARFRHAGRADYSGLHCLRWVRAAGVLTIRLRRPAGMTVLSP
jgi:hypothetical protein